MKNQKQLRAFTTDFHTRELRFERARAASRGEDTRLLDAGLAASAAPRKAQ